MKTITATVPDRSGLEFEYLLKIGAYRNEGEVLKDALRQLLLARPVYRIDIAVKLHADDKISLGKAAELAGISFDETGWLRVVAIRSHTKTSVDERSFEASRDGRVILQSRLQKAAQ